METHVETPVGVEHANGGLNRGGRGSSQQVGIGLNYGELVDHRRLGPDRFIEATVEAKLLCVCKLGPCEEAAPGRYPQARLGKINKKTCARADEMIMSAPNPIRYAVRRVFNARS